MAGFLPVLSCFTVFCVAKGGLLQRKRPSLKLPKAVFSRLKCRLLVLFSACFTVRKMLVWIVKAYNLLCYKVLWKTHYFAVFLVKAPFLSRRRHSEDVKRMNIWICAGMKLHKYSLPCGFCFRSDFMFFHALLSLDMQRFSCVDFDMYYKICGEMKFLWWKVVDCGEKPLSLPGEPYVM